MNKKSLERGKEIEELLPLLERKLITIKETVKSPYELDVRFRPSGNHGISEIISNSQEKQFNDKLRAEIVICLDRIDRLFEKEIAKLQEEFEML